MHCSKICGAILLLLAVGCNSGPRQSDIEAVKIRSGYSHARFQEDIAGIRRQHWPNRNRGGGEQYMRVFEQADINGVTRHAMLRMLGPADGHLIFERPPPPKHTMFAFPEPDIPRLTTPVDDRSIYRLGYGHNHGPVYTVVFEKGRVSEIVIQMGH